MDERDRRRAIDEVLSRLDSQAGARARPAGVISSGLPALDEALGGGYPRGRVVEIFGAESSGKTTLLLAAAAETQRARGTAAFIDAEHALDAAYARAMGVDLDALLVAQPDYGEQALEIAAALVACGAVDLVAIDSAAALVPKAELEGWRDDRPVGLQAELISQALRKLTLSAARTNTCLLFTNQIRERIGLAVGDPETTPGGRALKFYAAIRAEVRLVDVIRAGEAVIGSRASVRIVKNKVAAPFREAEFDLLHGNGIAAGILHPDYGRAEVSRVSQSPRNGPFAHFSLYFHPPIPHND